MAFTATVDEVGKGSMSYPTQPYIGLGKLEKFAAETIESTKGGGSKSYNVLAFYFRLLEGEEKGTLYRHLEFEPTDDNKEKLEKKQKSTFVRVAHIVSNYYPADTAEDAISKTIEKLSAKSFSDLIKRTIKVLEKIEEGGHLDVERKMKLVPEVYKGKGTPPSFTNYVPFLVDAEEEMSFSPDELKNIRAWNAYLAARPDKAESGGVDDDLSDFGGDDDGDDDDFDFDFD